MTLFERLTKKAQENRQRLVLPESLEPRTLQAADRVISQGIADVILIGKRDEILAKAFELDCHISRKPHSPTPTTWSLRNPMPSFLRNCAKARV